VNGSNLSWNESWSGKIHGTLDYLQGFFRGSRAQLDRFTGYAVIDGISNKIIVAGRGLTYTDLLSPDGQYLFVGTDRPGPWYLECWNIPPRKTLSAFGCVAVGWLLGCVAIRVICYCLALRRRKPVSV
jgi:hypothetical protein